MAEDREKDPICGIREDETKSPEKNKEIVDNYILSKKSNHLSSM